MKVFYYQLMQKRSFKRGIKMYIKITITPTFFGVITIIRERTM